MICNRLRPKTEKKWHCETVILYHKGILSIKRPRRLLSSCSWFELCVYESMILIRCFRWTYVLPLYLQLIMPQINVWGAYLQKRLHLDPRAKKKRIPLLKRFWLQGFQYASMDALSWKECHIHCYRGNHVSMMIFSPSYKIALNRVTLQTVATPWMQQVYLSPQCLSKSLVRDSISTGFILHLTAVYFATLYLGLGVL